jgi:hypothetical protein
VNHLAQESVKVALLGMDIPTGFIYNDAGKYLFSGLYTLKGAIAMKRWFSALLAALMLLCACGFAEDVWNENDVGFGEFDDGYDGDWVQVTSLGFEFCLPEGWSETAAPDGAVYAAAKSQGDATLSIRVAAENVDDLAAWGTENLKDSQPGTANFYNVLLTGGKDALSVYLIISDNRVLAFDFTRAVEEALSLPFALQIVGSACELWDDDDVPITEGDGASDFGEAFEADLG